jgi:hypothetical protein
VEGDDHGEAYTAIVAGWANEPRKLPLAEAETVDIVEGNMSNAEMRGAAALPWSEDPITHERIASERGRACVRPASIAGPRWEGEEP